MIMTKPKVWRPVTEKPEQGRLVDFTYDNPLEQDYVWVHMNKTEIPDNASYWKYAGEHIDGD